MLTRRLLVVGSSNHVPTTTTDSHKLSLFQLLRVTLDPQHIQRLQSQLFRHPFPL